jgi:hypothetical protein
MKGNNRLTNELAQDKIMGISAGLYYDCGGSGRNDCVVDQMGSLRRSICDGNLGS